MLFCHPGVQQKGAVLQIRLATVDDIPRLTALRRERYALLSQADVRFSAYLTNSGLAVPAADESNRRLFVAEENGSIVGYMSAAIRAGNWGIIEDIALDSHHYHGGLGRSLLKSARQWLAERDVQKVLVATPRAHAAEQAFWHALGAVRWHQASEDWNATAWTLPPEWIWMAL